MAVDTETAAKAAEASGGMPQLNFETYPNQWFWLAITLVILYFLLSRIALPRIADVLAERQGTITRDLETAEELKRKAEDAEEAYKKALADARAEAQRIVAEAKAEIQKDVDRATAEAEEQIAAKSAESEARIAEIRKGAMAAVEEVARDTAHAIVVAILPSAADREAVDKAVQTRLKG